MSVKIMGQVFELDLETREKFVLLALSDHADHDGSNCYPGIERLANKTGYSERSVQRALRNLEEQELIIPTSDKEGGRGLATVYKVDVEKGDTLTWFSKKGDMSDKKGDTVSQKGDTLTPQPSYNHKEPTTSPPSGGASPVVLDEQEKKNQVVSVMDDLDIDKNWKYKFAGRFLKHYDFTTVQQAVKDLMLNGKLPILVEEDPQDAFGYMTAKLSNESKENENGEDGLNHIPDPDWIREECDTKEQANDILYPFQDLFEGLRGEPYDQYWRWCQDKDHEHDPIFSVSTEVG